jgi:hypothetical protein
MVKLFVYIAGTLVGGGFGASAGRYGGPPAIGLGAIGGLLAGLLWCRLILGRCPLQRSRARSNLICLVGGPCAGVVVGWLATAVLWCGLAVVYASDDLAGLAVILIFAEIYFASPAGATTGLVCGIVAAIAIRRASRRTTDE